jgi:hypothetical protein
MMKRFTIYFAICLTLQSSSALAQEELPSKIKTKDGRPARDPIVTIGAKTSQSNGDYSTMLVGSWKKYKTILKHDGVKETKTDMNDVYHFYRDGKLIVESKDLNNKKIFSNAKYIVNGKFIIVDSGNDFSEPEKSKIIELKEKTLIIYSLIEDDEDTEEIWDYFIRR